MRNGFTKKNIGALTLGEKLKKFRSDRRVSLSDISKFTKIRMEYLEALEEGEYDKLPADVYIKGFLRSYADFLNVDEKIILKLYEREKEIKKNLRKDAKKNLKKPEKINISLFIFTPKKILLLLVFLVVFLGLIILYREVSYFSGAPRLFIFSPENNSEISENSVTVEGRTEKDASLFINDQSILVDDEGKFKKDLTLQPGLNIINVKAINKFGEETSEGFNILVKNQENENFDEFNEPNQKEEITLEIRVDPGPVWLNVEADEELVFSGNMLSGATQIFNAKEKIVISSGRGDATIINFNGKDLGVLSDDSGAVEKIVFDRNFEKNSEE
jgi:cytoskeleton protein RodZ